MNIARIVPVPAKDGSPMMTRGTKVLLGDVELTGITRIELTADVNNNVWMAVIHGYVQLPQIDAELEKLIVYSDPPAEP